MLDFPTILEGGGDGLVSPLLGQSRLVFTAAILMQKFPGSVKLTCPENQCHIMRRLENWNYDDLPATGYIYDLYHYIFEF